MHISAKLQEGFLQNVMLTNRRIYGGSKLINVVQFQKGNWSFVNIKKIIDETYDFKGVITYFLFLLVSICLVGFPSNFISPINFTPPLIQSYKLLNSNYFQQNVCCLFILIFKFFYNCFHDKKRKKKEWTHDTIFFYVADVKSDICRQYNLYFPLK